MSLDFDPKAFYEFSKLATHFTIGYNGGDYIYRWDGKVFIALSHNPANNNMYSNLFSKEQFLSEAEKAKNFLDASANKNFGWHFSSYIQRGDGYTPLS